MDTDRQFFSLFFYIFALLLPEEMEDPEMPGLISDSDKEADPDHEEPDQNILRRTSVDHRYTALLQDNIRHITSHAQYVAFGISAMHEYCNCTGEDR